jgi:hypothetical protein
MIKAYLLAPTLEKEAGAKAEAAPTVRRVARVLMGAMVDTEQCA